MSWFEWNGVRCTEHGITVLNQPDIIRPAERVTATPVPGRSGTLTTLEGEDVYDEFIATVECTVANTDNLPALSGWLRGAGKVTFANRQGGFYHARVSNQIAFEKVMRGHPNRTFAINFRCQPFFYLTGVEDITLTKSTTFVTNPGNVHSEPVITVYGSGDITLMVGTSIVELEGLTGSVTIDTPLMEAYSGIASLNGIMSGDFPTLKPGANAVSWSGSVTNVEVRPNWRCML